jgi:hypothetical protein
MRERLGVASYFVSACLTAPHLAGPFAARFLDRTARKQRLLAGTFVLYALALAGATLLLAQHLVLLAAVTLVIAGCCGPLLTGGLSSLLAALVQPNETAQRRAQGMDAFTYGVAGTGGTALIAIVAATIDPAAAVLAPACLACMAGAALLTLPSTVKGRVEGTEPALTVREAILLMLRTGGLHRTTVGTALSALPIGAVSLLAVVFALDHSGTPVQGAFLVTANGIGGLAGSTFAILRPLRGDPDRLIRWWTLAVAIGFALCASTPSILLAAAALFATGAAASIQFAASLAARSAYSPPAARAQIFVTMAGLKVAFSSLGVALVGLSTGAGSVWLLTASAAVVLVGTIYMFVDHTRALSPSQSR